MGDIFLRDCGQDILRLEMIRGREIKTEIIKSIGWSGYMKKEEEMD